MSASIATIIRDIAKLLTAESSTPILDAELLLAHALKKNREWIISHPEAKLIAEQEKEVFKLVKQRIQGKSISQILGKKEFWKYGFKVSDHTLVPRPDSETLIDALLKLCPNKKRAFKMADFGTGTGCLIITFLLEHQNSQGIALEKSKLAYKIARENQRSYKLQSRLKLMLGSWERCREKVDIIISNPPYIRKDMISSLPDTIQKYEPKIALSGGNSGLDCYHSIIRVAKRCLNKEGKLLLEIGGEKQLLQIKNMIKHTPFQFDRCYPDLSGQPRCILLNKSLS